ncbi:MAG: hypothetical protein NVS3B21_23060 [Acidimicrobiales bacterium]
MTQPTAHDAQIMLKLAAWYTESHVGEAVNWARSDAFTDDYGEFMTRYPAGSEGRLLVNRILGYYETVGTLWKNRLISEELLFDWLWVPASWDLVKNIAIGMRTELENVGLWENFEAMSERERAASASVSKGSRTGKPTSAQKRATPPKRATRRRVV